MVRIAKEKGFVAPTIYQCNYSPVSRITEDLLFPVLRRHGIAFYAYSPLAGGFLTKTRAQVQQGTVERFNSATPFGRMYATLFNKESYLDALSEWDAISSRSGIANAELAYRWMAHHSHLDGAQGDGLVFGATTLEQIRETISGISRGPLPQEVVAQIEKVWNSVKGDAGLDIFNTSTMEDRRPNSS